MKKITPDYTSLSQPVDHFAAVPFRQILFSTFGWLLLIIGITLIVLEIVLPKIAPDTEGISWTTSIIIAAGIILIGLAVVYAKDVQRSQRIYRFVRFAWQNGFDFLANEKSPQYPGQVFQQGNSRLIDAAMVLYDDKAWYEIGNYQYTIGYANAAQKYKHGYIRIRQQRQLPHVVLIGQKASLSSGRPLRHLITGFQKQQNFELEGDFYKYFTVYAPHKYEADALYILTPDVMAALVDRAQAYDIEIVNNELYLYRTKQFDLNNQADIAEALEICRIVGGEIDMQTDYYADQKIDDRSLDAVTTQGYRLRQRSDRLIFVYVGYLIVYAAALRNNSHAGITSSIMAVMSLGAIIFSGLERVQYKRASKQLATHHQKILAEYNK